MSDKPKVDINFERAALLMDAVQKQAHVAPAFTALSGVAMAELKEYNDVAQQYLNELGRQRLAEEQAAAARINAEAERQSRDNQPKTIPGQDIPSARRVPTPMPGEPVDERIDQETDVPQFPDDESTVARRV